MTRIMSAGRGRSGPGSRPGMILPVNRPQILPVDMGVELRRRNVGVAEHLLDGAQVGASLEKVRRERVPQSVRGDVLRDPGPLDVLSKDLPRAHPREGLAAGVQQELALPMTTLEPRPKLAKVHGHCTNGAASHGDEALLAALPEDADDPFLEENVANAQLDPLGDSES